MKQIKYTYFILSHVTNNSNENNGSYMLINFTYYIVACIVDAMKKNATGRYRMFNSETR